MLGLLLDAPMNGTSILELDLALLNLRFLNLELCTSRFCGESYRHYQKNCSRPRAPDSAQNVLMLSQRRPPNAGERSSPLKYILMLRSLVVTEVHLRWPQGRPPSKIIMTLGYANASQFCTSACTEALLKMRRPPL